MPLFIHSCPIPRPEGYSCSFRAAFPFVLRPACPPFSYPPTEGLGRSLSAPHALLRSRVRRTCYAVRWKTRQEVDADRTRDVPANLANIDEPRELPSASNPLRCAIDFRRIVSSSAKTEGSKPQVGHSVRAFRVQISLALRVKGYIPFNK